MNISIGQAQGFCTPGYESVAETFANLFESHNEQGAAVSIYRRGQLLVNLWGGARDKAGELPWQQQTRVNIFSAGKGLVALCVLKLVEQGKLDLDAPVASYWPEFSRGGKAQIRVRDVLCHRSGLSAFHKTVADEAIYDWQTITDLVASEQPWWTPGTEQGYSPMLFGWILGELVKRVSGAESFNAFFQTEIAGPLGVGEQCYFGVPEAQLSELGDMGPLKISATAGVSDASVAKLGQMMKADPKGVVSRAFTNPMSLMMGTNSPAWRQAEIPAANAHATAHSLAQIYGALVLPADGRELPGKALLTQESLKYCWEEQSRGQDKVLGTELRFSLGFMLSQERDDCRFGRGALAFGHPGAGGSLGFADPEYGIGFGYVSNRMGQGLLVDPRAKQLIDSLYEIEVKA